MNIFDWLSSHYRKKDEAARREALARWWYGVEVRLVHRREERQRRNAAGRKGAATKVSNRLRRAQEMFAPE